MDEDEKIESRFAPLKFSLVVVVASNFLIRFFHHFVRLSPHHIVHYQLSDEGYVERAVSER